MAVLLKNLKSLNQSQMYLLAYDFEGHSKSVVVVYTGRELIGALLESLRRWPGISFEELNYKLRTVVTIWATRTRFPEHFAATRSNYNPDALNVVERGYSSCRRSRKLLLNVVQSYLCLQLSRRSEEDVSSQRNAIRLEDSLPTTHALNANDSRWAELGPAFALNACKAFKSPSLAPGTIRISFHEIPKDAGREC
jgi:hypothetical protein